MAQDFYSTSATKCAYTWVRLCSRRYTLVGYGEQGAHDYGKSLLNGLYAKRSLDDSVRELSSISSTTKRMLTKAY